MNFDKWNDACVEATFCIARREWDKAESCIKYAIEIAPNPIAAESLYLLLDQLLARRPPLTLLAQIRQWRERRRGTKSEMEAAI